MIETNGNGHSNGSVNVLEYDERPGPVTPIADRMPPRSLEAEKSFLGCILLDNNVLRDVQPALIMSDFSIDPHQVFYQAMLDLFERGDPIDPVTVIDEIARMGRVEDLRAIDLITDIINTTPRSLSAPKYAKIIRDHSTTRRLLEEASGMIADGYSGKYTPEQLVTRFAKRTASIEHARSLMAADEELSAYPLPDKMDDAAFYGPVGDAVKLLLPETEGCAEGILVTFLTILSAAIGPLAHWEVSGDIHRCNLFTCTVGPSGHRKGTAYSGGRWLAQECGAWKRVTILRGLSSGEGLITALEKLRAPAISLETEFGGTLDNSGRQNNNLGSVLKQAWDGPHLEIMTKNNPVQCTHSFLGSLAHITYAELSKKLDRNDIENGLVGRYIWSHVYRAQELPRGGRFSKLRKKLGPALEAVEEGLQFGSDEGLDVPVPFDPKADAMWCEGGLYHSLSVPRPGLYGAATQRRAQHVRRLAVIFAVIDRVFYVGPEHLTAAMAIWDYCDRTAAHMWGSPKLEGDLGRLIAFVESAKDGVTRTDISRKVFGGHANSRELDRLIAQAQASGEIVYRKVKTGGAPRHEWVHRKYVISAKRAK